MFHPQWTGRMLAAVALAAATLWLAGSPPARAAEPAHQMDPLFTQYCKRCHNIDGTNAVCPDLSTIGKRRDEAYIRQSIVDPNAYVVPGFPKDVMPFFKFILKPEEVDQLVAYLLTLQGQTADPEKAGKGVKW